MLSFCSLSFIFVYLLFLKQFQRNVLRPHQNFHAPASGAYGFCLCKTEKHILFQPRRFLWKLHFLCRALTVTIRTLKEQSIHRRRCPECGQLCRGGPALFLLCRSQQNKSRFQAELPSPPPAQNCTRVPNTVQ